jgi:hypothetical protein
MDKIAMIKLIRRITIDETDLYEIPAHFCPYCGNHPAKMGLGLKKAKEIIDLLENQGAFNGNNPAY